jgi:hypothetical protein
MRKKMHRSYDAEVVRRYDAEDLLPSLGSPCLHFASTLLSQAPREYGGFARRAPESVRICWIADDVESEQRSKQKVTTVFANASAAHVRCTRISYQIPTACVRAQMCSMFYRSSPDQGWISSRRSRLGLEAICWEGAVARLAWRGCSTNRTSSHKKKL